MQIVRKKWKDNMRHAIEAKGLDKVFLDIVPSLGKGPKGNRPKGKQRDAKAAARRAAQMIVLAKCGVKWLGRSKGHQERLDNKRNISRKHKGGVAKASRKIKRKDEIKSLAMKLAKEELQKKEDEAARTDERRRKRKSGSDAANQIKPMIETAEELLNVAQETK